MEDEDVVVADPPQPTKPYVLRGDKDHVHNGKKVKVGQSISLTEDQYRAFSDKFAPVNEPEVGDPNDAPKPNTDEPQNLSAKTADMAKNPDPKPTVGGVGPANKAKA